MKKKSVISGRPKITDQSQDHCVDDTFCPKITVWTVAHSPGFLSARVFAKEKRFCLPAKLCRKLESKTN